jgi:hypothetical protein
MASLSDFYSKRRLLSIQLQDPITLAELKNVGFVWIRRHHRHLDFVLRNPTLGCVVEVTKAWDIGCVPIDSPAAKKLIRRICYF